MAENDIAQKIDDIINNKSINETERERQIRELLDSNKGDITEEFNKEETQLLQKKEGIISEIQTKNSSASILPDETIQEIEALYSKLTEIEQQLEIIKQFKNGTSQTSISLSISSITSVRLIILLTSSLGILYLFWLIEYFLFLLSFLLHCNAGLITHPNAPCPKYLPPLIVFFLIFLLLLNLDICITVFFYNQLRFCFKLDSKYFFRKMSV